MRDDDPDAKPRRRRFSARDLRARILPLVGILVYLVVRGNQMRVHAARELRQQDEMMRRSILGVVGSQPSPGDELTRLAELRDRGDITADEYRRLKARVVGDEPVAA